MQPDSGKTHAQAGDLAQLVSPSNKIFLIRLTPGEEFHTHRGFIHHDDLIGLPWGSQVPTHKGSLYYLLQPTLSDLLLATRRNTQIMYPKDIGFVLVTMGIGPGKQVLEAGTGSGALTTALAWAVGAEGRVISYEARPEMQRLAVKNLQRLGLAERVTPYNAAANPAFQAAHIDLTSPHGLALLNSEITRQAGMIAYLDDFQLIMAMTLMLTPLLFLFRRGRKIEYKYTQVRE